TTVSLYRWIGVGDFQVNVAALIDPLSSVMLLVVTVVGTLIFIFANGYMAHDHGIHRFFTWFSLFVFAMLILVMADNYLLMFVGWEGVGLCSYLLIGSWFERQEPVFDGEPARLHVPRARRRRAGGRDLPPRDARVLQGAALPRLGLGHPRDAERAGHASDGWAAAKDAGDVLDDAHRRGRARGDPAA